MVAVLPFSLAGRAENQYLGPGMVDLLSTTLDGAGDLHTASPHAVLATAARETNGRPLDQAAASAIADRLGAGLYVLGTVVDVGGHLRVNAALYESHATDPMVSAVADGDTTDLFGLVDRLSAKLITGQARGPSARTTQLASVTTRSLPALKAYLEGEAAFRANKFDAARDAFERAVAADSAFALAYYRLSIVAEWLTLADLAERTAERAFRFSDRLAPHDRQLFAALLANRQGDIGEAERIYRSIVRTYPDDIEAWWQLGEILFHNGPLLGRPLSDSYAPFARVLALDLASTPALVHLARVAAAAGNRGEVDSLVARALALAPAGERAYEMRVLRAAIDGDSVGMAGLVREFADVDDFQTWLSGWSLALYVHRSDLARPILERLIEPSRPPEVRARGRIALAALDAMHGRLHDAESELADTVAPGLGLEYHGLVTLLPFRPPDTSRVRAIRGLLDHWDAARMPIVAAPSIAFNANNGIHALIRGYLLGLCDAELGDARAAQRDIANLSHAYGSEMAPGLARNFAAAISAEVSWLAGRGTEADSALASKQQEGFYEWFIGSAFRSEGRERFRHGQALAAMKQDTAAIRWFSSFDASSSDDLMYLAPSRLERGQLEERLGRTAQAANDYREFIRLWSNPDPELRPLVDEAQHRLAALGSRKD
jgi:tetratricopeptide (TPR) repeat protein